jgi:hypothetical protein
MLGAGFRRCSAMNGRTYIFVLNYITFVTVNVDKYCIDFDIEFCAVKIQKESSYFCVLSVYRAPSGHFTNFMFKMDKVLKSLYIPKTEFIISYVGILILII